MVIDYSNYQDIKRKISLHDSNITSIDMDIDRKRIRIHFVNNYFKPPKKSTYTFDNVIYLQMAIHSPWGDSNEINGLHFDEKDDFENRYHPLWENITKGDQDDQCESFLDGKLMITINFFSGNITRIICSSLEVEENGLEG